MNGLGTGVSARADGSASELLALLGEFGQSARLTAERKQVRGMLAIVRRFLWTQDVNGPRAVTGANIEAYLGALAERGRSAKTVLNHASALSSFCAFLMRRGLLAANPCRGIALRQPEERVPRYLEDDEIAEVLRIARAQHVWPEIALALSTGLRLSELIRLQWPDVAWSRRCLTVRRSKSRRPRVVPLSRSALLALRLQRRITGGFTYVFPARRTWRGCLACRDPARRYADRPRASDWWGGAIRPIQQAVPKFRTLPGCSTGRGWHLFRHTFASRLAQRGVSLFKIASFLGHSDVRTAQIYAHLQTGYDPEIEAASPTETFRGAKGEQHETSD